MTTELKRMRQLVGTTADWAANDLVIGDGELAIQRRGSVFLMKIGDGVKRFSELENILTDSVLVEEFDSIQQALDSGAREVVMSSPSYNITAPIMVPTGVKLKGQGNPIIVAAFAALAHAVVLADGASAEGFTIQANAATRTEAAATLGVAQGYNFDPKVKGLAMGSNTYASRVRVVGVYLGFESSETSAVSLDACETFETGWGATSFYHVTGLRISGGRYWKCGGFGGVMLPSCQDFRVSGLDVYNKTGTGINPGGSSAAGYNVERGTIVNCTVEAGDCINAENGALDLTIAGNVVRINSELGFNNGTGIACLSHPGGGGPVSSVTIVGNTVSSLTGGEGIKFGGLEAGQFVDRVNVSSNTVKGTRIGIYHFGSLQSRDCRIFGNVIGADTGGIWLSSPARRLEVAHNSVTTSSGVTIGNYYGIYILNALTDSKIRDNITTGWGAHYRQEAVCTNTRILDVLALPNETDGAPVTVFSSSVDPSVPVLQSSVDGPSFSAQNSVPQALTAGASTKVNLGLEQWDTSGAYDPATSRFTPQVPGFYFVTGAIYEGNTGQSLSVQKNGALVLLGQVINGATNVFGCAVNGLVFLDGSTDYIELSIQTTIGTTIPMYAGAIYFQAAYVRGAA